VLNPKRKKDVAQTLDVINDSKLISVIDIYPKEHVCNCMFIVPKCIPL